MWARALTLQGFFSPLELKFFRADAISRNLKKKKKLLLKLRFSSLYKHNNIIVLLYRRYFPII